MPDIGQPSASDKNSDDEIRDAVVSDATRFPGGFIDERITEAGASIQVAGRFQLNNASFFDSFDISPQTSSPRGVALKPDGSRLYVVSKNSASVNQYNLSTAFDVTTASFVQSFDVSSQDGGPQGVDFKPDGGQMYVVGSSNDNVNEYSLSTAYDISTASFDQSFDVSPQDTIPTGLSLKPDGSRLYVVGRSNNNVYQYSLSTAFDVTTASFVKSLDISPQDGFQYGLAFRSDGSQLYVLGNGTDKVYQYAVGFLAGEFG